MKVKELNQKYFNAQPDCCVFNVCYHMGFILTLKPIMEPERASMHF